MAKTSRPKERWDNDADGLLDDVVVPDVAYFHLERMSNSHWWIGLYRKDGSLIHIDIFAKRASVVARRRSD